MAGCSHPCVLRTKTPQTGPAHRWPQWIPTVLLKTMECMLWNVVGYANLFMLAAIIPPTYIHIYPWPQFPLLKPCVCWHRSAAGASISTTGLNAPAPSRNSRCLAAFETEIGVVKLWKCWSPIKGVARSSKDEAFCVGSIVLRIVFLQHYCIVCHWKIDRRAAGRSSTALRVLKMWYVQSNALTSHA